MNKLFILLALVATSFVSSAQTKVGHINSSELIEQMPDADTIQQILEKEQALWQEILKGKEEEYVKNVQKYQEKADDPATPPQMLELYAKEAQQTQTAYQELQQQASKALQLKQEELLEPLLNKVKKAIEEVAKEKGFDYVMDSSEGSGIIYSDQANDLMPLVKAKLGVK